MGFLYHGNRAVEGILGYADHMLMGFGQFEDRWERHELIVNMVGNADNRDGYDLVLKNSYSCDSSSGIMLGRHSLCNQLNPAVLIIGHPLLTKRFLLPQRARFVIGRRQRLLVTCSYYPMEIFLRVRQRKIILCMF